MNMFESLTRLIPGSIRSLMNPARSSPEQAGRLADILQVPAGALASIRMGPLYHYRPFQIPKRDGRERRILAPSPALKTLQRRLYDNYLAAIPVHACATAFRAGFSIVDNARRHARQTLIATLDLRDFFESTHAGRVRAFFVKEGWRDDVLQTLMRLCVYRGGLPQGAPTSPCLSNLVNVPLDERLCHLAQRSGAVFTRYGDDLTFSWDGERLPGGFQQAVTDCLHKAGYEIQPCKGWRVSHTSDRPRVTGLVLSGNGRVRVPWAWRWRLWWLRVQSWWSGDRVLRARLHGYQGLVRMTR